MNISKEKEQSRETSPEKEDAAELGRADMCICGIGVGSLRRLANYFAL